MARPGQEAVHAITGDKVTFLEVGETFRMQLIRRPGNFSLGEHYHTRQTESFEVISGHAKYIANGKEGVLEAGQSVSFPPGTPHINPWNDGEGELCIHQILTPGLDFDILQETILAGAAKGHIRPDGSTKLLPQAVTLHFTKSKAYSTKLPRLVQQILFAILAPIGLLLGYRYGVSKR